MYDDFIYSPDPFIEEMTIERNGAEDYHRELWASEIASMAHEADMDDWAEEEAAKGFVGPFPPQELVFDDIAY